MIEQAITDFAAYSAEVLERCPTIEPVTEQPVWQPYAAARRFESLSLRFEVGPRR